MTTGHQAEGSSQRSKLWPTTQPTDFPARLEKSPQIRKNDAMLTTHAAVTAVFVWLADWFWQNLPEMASFYMLMCVVYMSFRMAETLGFFDKWKRRR